MRRKMRKRIAILSLSVLVVCMLLTACNEKNAVNGDAGEASIKDALKVAKIINKKSNLGLIFQNWQMKNAQIG